MDNQEILQTLSPDMTDETKKNALLKEVFPGDDKPPSEEVIQAIMRIIRKPTIQEASEGVYDAAVGYLKSIQRF